MCSVLGGVVYLKNSTPVEYQWSIPFPRLPNPKREEIFGPQAPKSRYSIWKTMGLVYEPRGCSPACPTQAFCLSGPKTNGPKVGDVLHSSCALALQQFQDLLSSSEAWPCQPGKSRSVASSGFSGPPLSLNLWVPAVAIVDSTCLGAPTLGVSDKRVAELMLGDVVIRGQAIVFTTCSGLATRKLHCLPTCLGRVCAFFSCPD